jgi:hypothetical protein
MNFPPGRSVQHGWAVGRLGNWQSAEKKGNRGGLAERLSLAHV